MENTWELITKTNLSYLNRSDIYSLVQQANFPNDFIDDLSICFESYRPNTFLNPDTLDMITTDYKIEKCEDSKYHNNRSIYLKCKLIKK